MSIYTRTGDTGMTSLFGGKRVLKCEELVDVYGSIDELNSWIGLIGARRKAQDVRLFQTIQEDLFTIGSTLAGWPARNASASVAGGKGDLKEIEKRVGEMEKQIDAWEKELPDLMNFILPGGSQDAARVHIARAICRRVERQTVALSRKQSVNGRILKFLNRLSDLLFMLARIINKELNIADVPWSGTKRPDVNK